MANDKVRVILADDHEVFRDSLLTVIELQEDMEVVAAVGTGRSAVLLTEKLKPHVVLMDIGMPDLNGIDATRQIVRQNGDTRVLCLTMHDEEAMISSMLRAGASGYLVKNCASEELLNAIRMVAQGKTYLASQVAEEVVREYVVNRPAAEPSIYSELSEREREVLQLIAEGHNTKEIAASLNISDKTVAAHRLNLMEKTDSHSVADLTRYAIRRGLVNA